MYITCPRCRGNVQIPEAVTPNTLCPHCRQYLLTADPQTGAVWTPRRSPMKWLAIPGWILAVIALIGFCTGYAMEMPRVHVPYDGISGPKACVVAGVREPLFFLCLPVAILLIRRAR